MPRWVFVLAVAMLAGAMAFSPACDSGGGSSSSASGGGSSGGGSGSTPAAKATFSIQAKAFILGSAAGNPASSPAGTWVLTGAQTGPGYFIVKASYYGIGFGGDTSSLPDTVPVTVTWAKGKASTFWWGTQEVDSGSETLAVPKQDGGAFGFGGNLGGGSSFRPTIVWLNPPVNSANQVLGTVTLEAPGVQTLTLTVVNANF